MVLRFRIQKDLATLTPAQKNYGKKIGICILVVKYLHYFASTEIGTLCASVICVMI